MKGIKARSAAKKKEERTVRLSIAFKSSIIYTLLFGVALTAAVSVLTWGLAARVAREHRLESIAMMLVSHAVHDAGHQFDYDAFARANNIYIEINRAGDGPLISFGNQPKQGVRYDEIRKHADLGPGQAVFLHVIDLEMVSPVEHMTIPGFLVSLAVLLVAAAFAGAFLMRRVMRPVYDMTRTVRTISASDLSRRIEPVRSHDELRELAGTFNGMLDRIQTAYERQKRFVSDASHELRTPLSVISGYANLLRRWGGDDRAVRDEAVEKIIEETGNMHHLVESLLFLARADGETQTVHPQLFCADDMMREVVEETRLIDKNHTVAEKIEPEVMLTADPALMKQAVRAVVENSRKYTPAGGVITLSCASEPGCVVLSVEDTGVGISEENLPHVFDRFYKADAARTRGTCSSSGLGLSIVKWIVERSGGEVAVRSKQGEGTCVIFRMPVE